MTITKKRAHELECMDVHEDAIVNKPDLYDDFDTLFWEEVKYLRYLPAELASLRAIEIYFEKKKGLQPLGKDDKIRLLHSTNACGTYCATLLREVIVSKNLLSDVNVELLPVEGLDPSDDDKFITALQNIWTRCVEIFGSNNKTDYIFNLTGGYKSVATFFGGAAYFIDNVQIFSVHEETNFERICMMKFSKTGEIAGRFNASTFDVSYPPKNKRSWSPGRIDPI